MGSHRIKHILSVFDGLQRLYQKHYQFPHSPQIEYDNIILPMVRSLMMGMHRKTITLTEHQDDWVKTQIESGNFGNDSEYIRHLIRRDQQSQERLNALRQALQDGESSGETKPLNMQEIKAAGRARAKATD
ncbi:type II toxin-antitoxin system ParD family antitoxin [Pseudidiomarina aestuarii]